MDAYGSEPAVSDKSPKPQEPDTEVHEDPNEPAFDWMKPKTSSGASPATPAASTAATPSDNKPSAATASTPTTPATGQPGSRADRKAAEAADVEVEPPLFADTLAGASTTKQPSHYSEPPLPTSALQIRPPEDEVARRNAEREQAAKVKPVGPRIFQVLLAVFYPVILLVLAVRAVTSPLFLWVEYNRPGFPPGDGYGFSTDDRMTYGSYAVDYLSNWAGRATWGGLGQPGRRQALHRQRSFAYGRREAGHSVRLRRRAFAHRPQHHRHPVSA